MDAIPAEHRLAYFGLGQITNETAILLRAAISAINWLDGEPDQHVKDAANATAMFSTRILAGRLYEGRQFINSREVATAFREVSAAAIKVHPNFERDCAEARTGRAQLAQLIDGSSLIEPLRNRVAFHAEAQLIADAYDRLPDQIDFVDHLALSRGNSIFGGAESLHLAALSVLLEQRPDKVDYELALSQAVNEIGEGVGHLNDFAMGYMVGFVLAYFGLERLQADKIEVPDAVLLNEMRAPLFSVHKAEDN